MKSRRLLSIGCVCVLGLALLCFWLAKAEVKRFYSSIESIKETCQPTVEWLEAERVKTGRYPKTLLPEYRKALNEMGFQVRYFAKDEDSRCLLSIGNYRKNGGVLNWSSEHEEWWLNN